MRRRDIERLLSVYDKENNVRNKRTVNIISNKFKSINYKLYKYYSLDSYYTLNNLENEIVFLNRPDAFNDPFDCNIGYSYLDCIQELCFCFIMDNQFQMSDSAVEAFTKFIFDEPLLNFEENFLNESIKKYGNKNSDTKIEDWYYKRIDEKLILICDLLCDNGEDLAEEIITSSKNMVELQNNVKKAIDDNFAITCFSEEYNNELMWAHYADKHRGICVEYDLSKYLEDIEINYYKFSIFPVIYSIDRPQIPIRVQYLDNLKYRIEENEYSLSDRIRYLLTKSKAWQYEKEWRMILPEKGPLPHKFPFISKIFMGANISEINKKKIEELARSKGIEAQKIVLSKNTYKLI